MNEPEWIEWTPDSPGYPNCPVEPGTDCEVRWRVGGGHRNKEPQEWSWRHGSVDNPLLRLAGDIIAYRVWPAAEDARALLEWISDELASACQADCENGVKWLNERAAAAYLKDAPATLEAIKAVQDRIDAYLERNP
jgi:hypothetical protein